MMNTKYTVYYNDEVNEMAAVFSADTIGACTKWIDEQLEGKTSVDALDNENVFNTSKTFIYEIYDRPVIKIVDGEAIYNEPIYSTDYYYVH